MPGEEPTKEKLFDAVKRGDIADVKRLLDSGADIEARDQFGDTPLHLACEWCAYNTIEILIERGADVGARNNAGRTPLDFVCDLPESNPAREPLLEIFRDRFPEAYFTKFCEYKGRQHNGL